MATVNEGRDNVVDLIGAGLSGEEYGSAAIGTSGAAVSDGQGNLQNTLDTDTGNTATSNGNTMSLVGTFTGNSASVREASIYANSSSIMLARQVVSTINVESSDTLEVTWDVNISDA